jgi:hypothetical protein
VKAGCSSRYADRSAVSARRMGRLGVGGLPIPGQEFGNTPCRMLGDAGEHVGGIVLRVESV